ncbi:MAG TPA: MBL fold metallo-hydrolase [Candidatus Acidoferrales bacterium]|jgi:L-ascorbate metabolism protein UlaG (beta-lactamase superfamily)|nr:MBL fold metallo-hydrolase [Candidatus Acidoferrales bacterium]
MDTLKITLIGGPTALLEVGGLRVLTDPTFDPPSSYTGAITLTKLTGPALTPQQIGRVDAVLLSHDQHFDNLDRSGRDFLTSAGTVWTTHGGAQRLGKNANGLAPWKSTQLRSPGGRIFQITATPARHGPVGVEPIAGEVIGFVISTTDDEPLIYVTGDTVWYDGVAEVAKRFPVKVVVLFAGAVQIRGPFCLTMDTNDALETAAHFPGAAIVPVQTEGWQHFKQSQEDLVNAFAALGVADRLHPLRPGIPLSLEI